MTTASPTDFSKSSSTFQLFGPFFLPSVTSFQDEGICTLGRLSDHRFRGHLCHKGETEAQRTKELSKVTTCILPDQSGNPCSVRLFKRGVSQIWNSSRISSRHPPWDGAAFSHGLKQTLFGIDSKQTNHTGLFQREDIILTAHSGEIH